jgi:CheY-like chemotaxis protein
VVQIESKPSLNILLVDDRRENLLALEAALASPEYNLYSVTTGEEALKLILRMEFAVILLDVHMPNMDGFEIAELVKKRYKSRHIPIIFITAGDNIDNVTQAYDIGAIDYIIKPFDPKTLKRKVEGFVNMHRNTQEVQMFERMQFAGEIAVGIAHEIRNPMTTVYGFLKLSKSSKERPSDSIPVVR